MLQNQIGVWGQRWVFLVLMGIRSGPPPPLRVAGHSPKVRPTCYPKSCVAATPWITMMNETAFNSPPPYRVAPPHTHTAQTLYTHNIHTHLAARSPRWLMSWLTGVSNMEEIVNQPGRRDAAVVWRCHCRKCWKCQTQAKHQEASLGGEGLVVIMFEQRRGAPTQHSKTLLASELFIIISCVILSQIVPHLQWFHIKHTLCVGGSFRKQHEQSRGSFMEVKVCYDLMCARVLAHWTWEMKKQRWPWLEVSLADYFMSVFKCTHTRPCWWLR